MIWKPKLHSNNKYGVCLKLRITHDWLEWRPKQGAYAGKVKMICVATSPKKDSFLGQPAMLAGITKGGKLHMHLASITPHQYQENTLPLTDNDMINSLEEKFVEYQAMWEKRRLIKVAKGLLIK